MTRLPITRRIFNILLIVAYIAVALSIEVIAWDIIKTAGDSVLRAFLGALAAGTPVAVTVTMAWVIQSHKTSPRATGHASEQTTDD